MTAAQQGTGPDRLGPYRLRRQLGEGGMGVVYLAADSSDRQVAVKALRFGAAGDLTAKRRLAREVETMRRVHSPYVAEIIDADVEGTPPYIVTRYVPGSTLDEVVSRQGPLAGQSLVRLAHGLAAALTAVHSAGVVHRDLKPGNVMLVDGDPIVIDFGIAQVPDATRITMTGMFMGTPGYLAPEVIEGRPSGPAADVHSWGATVAFAATGRPPFGTGSFEAIFYQIVHGQPDLAGVPAPLLQLVVRALARDPARRPAATELVSCTAGLDLSAWLPGAPGTAVPAAGLLPAATAADVQVRRAAGLPAVNGAPAPPGIALPGTVSPGTVSPGTRPMAVGAPPDFRDLLPPVSYRQPVPFAPAPAMAPAGTPAAAVAGPAALAQP
ncbi:MAG: protein kinase domain-containing protein, partial [Streptosporangiaceae bacterium]